MASCLSYDLIRSKKRRRTISVHIKEDGRVIVQAPYNTPTWELEKFIEEKQSWIVKRISEREKRIKEVEKAFLPGERFLYLGEWYPLELDESNRREPHLKLSFGKFILQKDHLEGAKGLFIQWYKREAKEKVFGRINYYSHRLDLFPKAIRLTNARSRWGSCSRDNRLSFSWRIIMAPLTVTDYVLIHELAHIREKDHSKRFWTYLESIFPDYRKQRLWLKKNGYLLQL